MTLELADETDDTVEDVKTEPEKWIEMIVSPTMTELLHEARQFDFPRYCDASAYLLGATTEVVDDTGVLDATMVLDPPVEDSETGSTEDVTDAVDWPTDELATEGTRLEVEVDGMIDES